MKSNEKTKKSTKTLKSKKTNEEIINNEVQNKQEEIKGIEIILNQIKYILLLIAILLFIAVILLGINGKSSTTYGTSSGNNEEQDTQQLPEYDVTEFTEITVDEMFNKVATSGYQVVYIGRIGCGYCRLFLDSLKQAQTNFKYKTLYIDLDKVTSDGAKKMKEISDDLNKNFGSTPMVLVYKDGEYKEMWLGYAQYSEFEKFLLKQGMTK